jgi:hypothetical protein
MENIIITSKFDWGTSELNLKTKRILLEFKPEFFNEKEIGFDIANQTKLLSRHQNNVLLEEIMEDLVSAGIEVELHESIGLYSNKNHSILFKVNSCSTYV